LPAPLRGVRVVEVATHVFVPMAGAVLTEWGAEVVKVEAAQCAVPEQEQARVERTKARTTGGIKREQS
jgi:crotonobetainyl-CoA:carnitine CoA-transferase CaiB-like acyl-CoA transferase